MVPQEALLSLWQLRSSLPRTSRPLLRLLHPDHLQLKCSLSNSAFQRVRPDLRDRRGIQASRVRRVIKVTQVSRARQELPEQRAPPIRLP